MAKIPRDKKLKINQNSIQHLIQNRPTVKKSSADSKTYISMYFVTLDLYDITWHLMTYDVIQWHQMSENMLIYTWFWNQHRIYICFSLFWSKSENVVKNIFFSSFGCWPFSGNFERFVPWNFGRTRGLFLS